MRFDWNDPAPLLRRDYSGILTTTSRSVPACRIGTRGLAFLRLAVSLNIDTRVPAVPRKRLDRAHAISMPDTAHPVNRLPMGLSRE